MAMSLMHLTFGKSSFKFTNIKCKDHDIDFAHFDRCKLLVIGRGVVSLDIKVDLYKTPVSNVSLNIALYKRASGYRPFLYNITQDLCAFFRNRKRYPIAKVLLEIFLSNTNVDSKCPITEAFEIKNFLLNEESFRLLPIPEGDYLFKMHVFAYNDLKATVEVYFNRKDGLLF
uniref:MD-2-related lipid-recognition domain-containing protein n=1 Tax=Stomoxys calcitrans TaxID=35570 RepID=A0A1I8Q855_STOCA